MLDAYGYKSTAEDTKQFDLLAKQIFLEETGQDSSPPTTPLDSLIGHDQNGNLWIYASEQAKQYAQQSRTPPSAPGTPALPATKPPQTAPIRPALKALTQLEEDGGEGRISRAESEPAIPTQSKSGQEEGGYSYAKTLRLTSEQLVPSPDLTELMGEIVGVEGGEEFFEF
jgi:phosphatidate phosphatase LPIN